MNHMKTTIAWVIITGCVITMTALYLGSIVSADEVRPESGTTFRHRWWNYYTRALDRADALNYTAAQTDLREALSRRDGDQRMARTYGMHFIDYFPNRELGVIQYLTGHWTEAEKALEKSIQQSPSAKARYYLDLVRKAKIQASGAEVTPPVLRLDFPEETFVRQEINLAGKNGHNAAPGARRPDRSMPVMTKSRYWTRQSPVPISGLVRDNNYVAAISVAGVPIFFEGAQKKTILQHHTRPLPRRP